MARPPDCRVYWGSHGCHLEREHDGDCECDCCDCDPHVAGTGCVGKAPYYGPDTRFYGEDFEARGLPGHDVPYEPVPCAKCGLGVVLGEPDPCLGELPGVWGACCGHGKRDGYIAFKGGTTIRFNGVTVDGVRMKSAEAV